MRHKNLIKIGNIRSLLFFIQFISKLKKKSMNPVIGNNKI